MINFATILKPHKNMKPGGGYCQHGVGYDLEYQTEIGEDEVLITAAIRIKAKTKSGKKILSSMTETDIPTKNYDTESRKRKQD